MSNPSHVVSPLARRIVLSVIAVGVAVAMYAAGALVGSVFTTVTSEATPTTSQVSIGIVPGESGSGSGGTVDQP